jgi:hypothetical protein
MPEVEGAGLDLERREGLAEFREQSAGLLRCGLVLDDDVRHEFLAILRGEMVLKVGGERRVQGLETRGL